MKKLLVIAIVLGFVVACEKEEPKPSVLCEVAKVGVDLMSTQIAARWACDKAKVSDFLMKPVNDKVCNAEKNLVSSVCPLVIGYIKDLGAAQIVSKFSCDLAKVEADLNQADRLCDLLSK